MSNNEQRTLNVKVPDKLRSKHRQQQPEQKAVNVQDYPLYYEAEALNEEEYKRKHAKFVRKTEPAVAQVCNNLTDALSMFKDFGTKFPLNPVE